MTSKSDEQKTNIDREKLRDCFREFSDDGDYASVSQLPSMIEYLHYPLPENFYEKTCIDFQLKENQKFDFEKFCEFLAPRNRDTDEWKKLHDAFEVFDNSGNGKISVSELSEILITFGNAFTTEEINHMKAIAKPDENDLIDINLITDLLVDDMFDHLEEEEEEEENIDNEAVKEQNSNYKNQSNNYQNKPSRNQQQQNNYQDKTSNSKQQQIDDQEKSSSYQQQQQPNEYQMQSNYSQQSNEYQEQSNEYQGQSNEYQDQYNDDQGQYTDDQGQYYDYQGQSNEYQEQPDYYQDQYEQAEEEEIYDQNEVYNDSNN